MLSIKTLYSLLFIVFLLAPTQGKDITPTVIKDSQPRKFIKFSSSDYRPINIALDHSNVNVSDISISRKSKYLNESILPPVMNLLRSALKVLPRSSKIIAKPEVCRKEAQIPAYASETGYDSDLVIFVTILDNIDYGFDYPFVKVYTCDVDETTNRPTIGVLEFQNVDSSGPLSPIEVERRVALTLREMIHILGFQEKLFPFYVNPETLQPLTGHFFNKTVNDVNTLVLNVAPLTERIRDYFNCPTAEGAYLENQGSNLIHNSHFEKRIFGEELMTAGEMYDRRLSQFTLALLEGTGWYKVNYDLAEPMTYGKGQGCAFLDTKCLDPVTLKPNFKEFCSPLASKGVGWAKRGFGFCGADSSDIKYEANPNLEAAFDYWGNKTVVHDKFSDNCPSYYTPYEPVVLTTFQEFDCENLNYLGWSRLPKIETRSPSSKAFMGTLSSEYSKGKPRDYGGYCFTPKCVSKSNGNYEVQIPIGTLGVLNCSAAGWVNATDFGFQNSLGGALECPDPNEFCERILSDKYCRGGCYGRGACSQGECKCQDGWGYGACLVRQEAHQSARCTQDVNRTTAYGDDCICSETNITCQCALGLKTGDQCKQKEDNNNGNNNSNNNNSGNQPTGGNNRAIYLGVGLVFVVVAVVCIKRRKQADDLNVALVQGRKSHDISAF